MIRNLNFKIDQSLNNQKKIGLIVLASDYTIDEEFRKLFPIANLDYYQARIENSPLITPETLSAMKLKISSTLKLILPGDKLDIVGYGCTSATVVLGEEEIFSSIKSVHPNAKCTTPISADIGVVHFALGCTDLIELKISSSPKTTVADVHPYPTISSLSPGKISFSVELIFNFIALKVSGVIKGEFSILA